MSATGGSTCGRGRDNSPTLSASVTRRNASGSGALALVGVLAALASVAVYHQVLQAYFWNDDFVWIYLLHDRSLSEVLFTPLGGHTLVARNALFALVHAVAGLDPRPYFATVLITHAINVLLLCRLVWLLTGSAALAGLGALAWGTCPAASETLAWYSVYGQIAALTCLLLACSRLAARARELDRLATRDLVVVGAWLALASILFGTAIAVAVVLPIVLAELFPGMLATGASRRALLAVSASVLLLHGALHLLALWVYSVPSVHVDALRWLVHGPGLAFFTFVHLVRVGVTSLILGPWWLPEDSSDVASWTTLLLVGIVWAGAVHVASRKARGRLLAFTVLALSSYALVAVSRGPMAGFFNATAAGLGATLRYHYTAQAFLIVTLCIALDVLASRLGPLARPAFAAGSACFLMVGHVRHPVPVDLHAASRSEVANALATVGARIADAPAGETVYLDNEPLAAFGWMPNIPVPLPGLVALFVIVSPSDEVDGRQIRFVERDPAVYQRFTALSDGRLASLLVPAPPSDPAHSPPPR